MKEEQADLGEQYKMRRIPIIMRRWRGEKEKNDKNEIKRLGKRTKRRQAHKEDGRYTKRIITIKTNG